MIIDTSQMELVTVHNAANHLWYVAEHCTNAVIIHSGVISKYGSTKVDIVVNSGIDTLPFIERSCRKAAITLYKDAKVLQSAISRSHDDRPFFINTNAGDYVCKHDDVKLTYLMESHDSFINQIGMRQDYLVYVPKNTTKLKSICR